MDNITKINKNLYRLNTAKIKLNNVYIPFKVSQFNNKYNLSIEINYDNISEENLNKIKEYKLLEENLSKLNTIENLDISDFSFYSNIKNNNYKNNILDLIRLSIKKQKNTFSTKYYKNGEELSIFDIEDKNYYNCEIYPEFLWINKERYGIILNLIKIEAV